VCMLWCTSHGEENHLDDEFTVGDIHPSTRAGLAARCNDFIDANATDLIEVANQVGYDFARAGHDFMLSSSGHGAGFFDRDLGEVGDRLDEAARLAGEIEPYAGDDRKVYVVG